MFFLFILVTIFILGFAIHTSKIGIEIENLVINTEKPKGEKINKESNIYLFLLVFGKIKLFKKNFKKLKIKNFNFQKKDIDIKFWKNTDFKINYKELLQNINVDIEQIELYLQIGTENAAITAILVGIISGIIGILVKKPKYKVTPIYINKNLLKLELNCIISIYLMQYIYKVIFDKIKYLKERTLMKREKCSNRKVEVYK